MADTELARIERMIQSVEAYGDDLAQAEQYAAEAIAERQQMPEAKDTLKEAIYAVERETTPKILQISRSLASIVGESSLDISSGISGTDICYRITKEGNKLLVEADKQENKYEICLTIDIKKERISLRYEESKYWEEGECGPILGKFKGAKHKVKDRLSRWSKTPKKAFRIVADRYAAEEGIDYLQAFMEMYAMVPKMVLIAAIRLRQDEAAKRSSLETKAMRIRGLAEGTR